LERIVGVALWGIEGDSFVGEKLPCEFIAINDSENSAIDINILT
jgi:hypothetical protein